MENKDVLGLCMDDLFKAPGFKVSDSYPLINFIIMLSQLVRYLIIIIYILLAQSAMSSWDK